ncbi:hypothetical protein D3C87_324140 [compost metagenome]
MYPVDNDDSAFICKAGMNHGRLCKVLHLWDGRAVMSNDYAHLKGEECFVVMSLGSPFVYEGPSTSVYYSMSKTHLLVVEAKHLKRAAHSSEIKWKEWN